MIFFVVVVDVVVTVVTVVEVAVVVVETVVVVVALVTVLVVEVDVVDVNVVVGSGGRQIRKDAGNSRLQCINLWTGTDPPGPHPPKKKREKKNVL